MPKKVLQFDGEKIPRQKIAIKKKRWTQLRRAHTNKQRKVNIGTWRLKQTINYIQYLGQNQYFMVNPSNSEKSLIFLTMARHIKTRTSLQCRSHHQKMMKTHGSIQNIIRYYSEVVIPYFQREEMFLRYEKHKNKQKKAKPFFKLTILSNIIRIEINQSSIDHY